MKADNKDGFECGALYKKKLTTKLVLPLMSVASVIFIASFYTDSTANRLVLLLAFVSVAGNIFLSAKDRFLNIGRFRLSSRSEGADTARWLYNLLIYDAILFYSFRPPLAGMAMAWLIVLLSAQADLFQRKMKTGVILSGLVVANAMVIGLYPADSLAGRIFVAYVLTAAVVIFHVSDNFWVQDIKDRLRAQLIERELTAETERLRFDALLGENLKFIMHEVNNLLFVLEMSTARAEAEPYRQLFQRGHSKMKQIANLVLGNNKGILLERPTTLPAVVEDLEILWFKECRASCIGVVVTVSEAAQAFVYKERVGSLFYVLYNLLKNSREAIQAAPKAPHLITLTAEVDAQNQLKIAITDTGCGMSEEQVRALLAGSASTTKAAGHGLGMRFVRSECQKNGFELTIPHSSAEGTTFLLLIQAASMSQAS